MDKVRNLAKSKNLDYEWLKISDDEIFTSILVHRDYLSAFPAKVIIEKDWLKTENRCISR